MVSVRCVQKLCWRPWSWWANWGSMWRTWRPASTGCCRYYIQADVIYLPYVLTDCMFLVHDPACTKNMLFSAFYPSGPEDCDAALSGPHVPPQRPRADRALSAVWSHSPPRLPLVRVSLMMQTTHFIQKYLIVLWIMDNISLFFLKSGRKHRRQQRLPPARGRAVCEACGSAGSPASQDKRQHAGLFQCFQQKCPQSGGEDSDWAGGRVFLWDFWNVNISMGEANSCDHKMKHFLLSFKQIWSSGYLLLRVNFY